MSMPMCLWFGRLLIDNAAHFSKIAQPRLRLGSSLCVNQWNMKNDNVSWHPKPMSTTATEEKSKNESDSQMSAANCSEKTPEQQIKLLTQEIENLTNKNEELSKKADEIKDRYMRALADGDNLRKRLLKQIEDAKLFGIQGFCKDLLEVADILGKATECVPKEEVSDSNPHLKNLYEGLTMTEAELQKVFKRHGLIPVNPIDEKFDPNLHEALFQQEVEGKAPGTVVVVSKLGYKLHERCIRPALVGVAKAVAQQT